MEYHEYIYHNNNKNKPFGPNDKIADFYFVKTSCYVGTRIFPSSFPLCVGCNTPLFPTL